MTLDLFAIQQELASQLPADGWWLEYGEELERDYLKGEERQQFIDTMLCGASKANTLRVSILEIIRCVHAQQYAIDRDFENTPGLRELIDADGYQAASDKLLVQGLDDSHGPLEEQRMNHAARILASAIHDTHHAASFASVLEPLGFPEKSEAALWACSRVELMRSQIRGCYATIEAKMTELEELL